MCAALHPHCYKAYRCDRTAEVYSYRGCSLSRVHADQHELPQLTTTRGKVDSTLENNLQSTSTSLRWDLSTVIGNVSSARGFRLEVLTHWWVMLCTDSTRWPCWSLKVLLKLMLFLQVCWIFFNDGHWLRELNSTFLLEMSLTAGSAGFSSVKLQSAIW